MRVFSTETEKLQNDQAIPTKTHKILPDSIEGYIDGREAIGQAVQKRLSTERFEHPIYSFRYGMQWKKLIGKEEGYVRSELRRMVTESLMEDDRIRQVYGFSFQFAGDTCTCTFSVDSEYGEIETGIEVKI